MKSKYLTFISLLVLICLSACFRKEPCPDFESDFLEYYPVAHEQEIIFENVETADEATVIAYRMRVDHVSALKQNVINGKNTCECWSKISFGFDIPEQNRTFSMVLTQFENSLANGMDITLGDEFGVNHDYYELYYEDDYENHKETIEEYLPAMEDYLIYTGYNDSFLVFEKGIGVVLIAHGYHGIWKIKNIPVKKNFNWNNLHYEEFKERC